MLRKKISTLILTSFLLMNNQDVIANNQNSKISDLPQWNLNEFYDSIEDPQITQDMQLLLDGMLQFEKKYKNKIKDLDADGLLESLEEHEKREVIVDKLFNYVYLMSAIEADDKKVKQVYQKLSEKLSEVVTHGTFYVLEIGAIPEENLQQKLLENPKLQKYYSWFRDIKIRKKYQLPEAQERILTLKSVTSSEAWIRLFEELMVKMRFEFQGQKITESEVLNKLSDDRADLRKEAYYSFAKTLAENNDLLTMITNVLVKDKAINDELRGFKKPISSMNLGNFILDDTVVDNLLQTIYENYPKVTHRYYKLKAQVFGDETLNPWDVMAPFPKDANMKKTTFSWQESKKIIIDAYHDFSPLMGQKAQEFYDNNWIDAQPREGKRSGAFALYSDYVKHPYILTNFFGTTRDVSTVAHEIGHGIHFQLSAHHGVLMSNATLTLCETASVFGEHLTFLKMKQMIDDKKEKLYLLASKIEDSLATMFRQVMFARFETKVHDARKNNELLPEDIAKIWMDENKAYFGDVVKHGEEYEVFWSYIPHFIFCPFYVYSYAFGNCFVNTLYNHYLEHPENFAEKYIEKILKVGCTRHYDEIMRDFNMNPKDKDFWQGGIDLIIEMIDEFEVLLKELNMIK